MEGIIASTYDIQKKIGYGGGGVVYLAKHLRLQKDVVLKVDKRHLSTSEDLLRREVNVLKELRHPSIPQVYDFFVENDTVYTVIDYIQGESLDKPLRRGEHFSQQQVVKWGRQLLGALSYLHSPTHGDPPRGYVHSDIKPANLMRTPDGDICLIDFNIALAIGEESVIGLSAGYASPEHYGLDYSTGSSETTQKKPSPETAQTPDRTDDATEREELPDAGSPCDPERQEQTGSQKSEDTDTQTRPETSSDTTRFEEQDEDTRLEQGSSTSEYETKAAAIIEETRNPEELRSDITALEDENAGVNQEVALLSSLRIERTSADNTTKTEEATDAPKVRHSNTDQPKRITPDVRSDIYSVGATLYHLLSGVRPAKDAKDVIPLSRDEYSPLLVDIITKAMQPNPDARFQTADEMLEAFERLRLDDPRVIRLNRLRRAAFSTCAVLAVIGVLMAFIGLKRIQTVDRWKVLVEYSKNALSDGDAEAAVDYALQAIPTKKTFLTPNLIPEAQKALTDALGVYDLSDSYTSQLTVDLGSEPTCIAISPDGSSIACIHSAAMGIYETETGQRIAEFPAQTSALSEAEYLNNDTVIFAGAEGTVAYSIQRDAILWISARSTSVSISANGEYAACVYRDDPYASIYRVSDGTIVQTVSFQNRTQRVIANDAAVNPDDNLFAINRDGSMLAVSFSDGSLQLFDLQKYGRIIELLPEGSGYTHFEGGFWQNCFAFSASGPDDSVFAVINTDTAVQTGGFQSAYPFSALVDERGIYVQTDNLLIKIDPESGDQTPLVTTNENILAYAVGDSQALISTETGFSFYGTAAQLLTSFKTDVRYDLLQIAGDTAVTGCRDSSVIRILKSGHHPEAEVFSYDPSEQHSEVRISADQKTVMLFSFEAFKLFSMDGRLISEVSIPDASEVYDQQFVRDEYGSRLEVTYNDGRVIAYSAANGQVLYGEVREPPDRSFRESFETDDYLISAQLHGNTAVYDKATGKELYRLREDAALSYITQADDNIVVQFITTDGEFYGLLLDAECNPIAELPYLCDVMDNTLYFDYPTGNVRETRIYGADEIIAIASQKEEK